MEGLKAPRLPKFTLRLSFKFLLVLVLTTGEWGRGGRDGGTPVKEQKCFIVSNNKTYNIRQLDPMLKLTIT